MNYFIHTSNHFILPAANKHTIPAFLAAAKCTMLTFLAAANKYTILTFPAAVNKYTIFYPSCC